MTTDCILHLDFSKFKNSISMQFNKMSQHDVFVTDVDKDGMWANYLASFPPGSNPIYRKRTEYDCSCCKQFVRKIGNAVAIIDGKIESIWDANIDEPVFRTVAASMSAFVKAATITDVFLHGEHHVGTDKNFERDQQQILEWQHFYVTIPHARNQGKNLYCKAADIPTRLGDLRQTQEVFLRGLTELTRDAIDTVIDFANQNNVYRLAEYKDRVLAFSAEKKRFDLLKADATQTLAQKQAIFAWSRFDKVPFDVARIRNIAVGTLMIDIANDLDLEAAVAKFEKLMDATNYKRPTALVSQKQVDAAKKTIDELGLASALERRFASLTDIKMTNIMFANRDAKKIMRGDAFEGIATKKTSSRTFDKVETISIHKFLQDIVPNVSSIELYLENTHEPNFVSLIAPDDPDAKPLLKWNNGFSWAYNGDVTDSIKERVKRAGGNVTGDFCSRLAWFNTDDLDLHMYAPTNRHIYYGMRHDTMSDGQLDVDMNNGDLTRTPVENIVYPKKERMQEGVYRVVVNQYRKRESSDVGFQVEIDMAGEVHCFSYDRPVVGDVEVAQIEYRRATGFKLLKSLPSTTVSRTIWDMPTQDFHKVNVLMKSPNHWDGEAGIGHRHYFFMLDGCRHEGQARGFFNEFLRDDLQTHRKVIEIVGSKMKTKASPDQLSGLGFSETRRAELLVRTKGNFTRMLKVMI